MKSSIYTRGGDKGRTSLADGTRVAKDDIRLEAYGTIDELGAHLGMLATMTADRKDRQFIVGIQNRLFSVASYLATPSKDEETVKCWITDDDVAILEQAIDRVDGQLEPLNTFVINGGCLSAAQAHVCRTVCRRAERLMVTLSSTAFIDPVLMRYVNRLSDFLFVFARYQNKQTDTPEIFWQKS